MPIAVRCQSCGQHFNLRDELAGRTVRCRCGKPLSVPSAAADSLAALLEEELSRPYEPPPERQAPTYTPRRRRRRAAAAQKARRVVSEPTTTQLLLWVTGGLTGWLLTLAALPTAAYVCLRGALQNALADAIVAGVMIAAMLVFNRGCFALLLRAPAYLGWARWGGVLGAVAFLAAGIVAQALAAQGGGVAASGLRVTSFFSNLAIAVLFAVIPAFVAVAAFIGPEVKPHAD